LHSPPVLCEEACRNTSKYTGTRLMTLAVERCALLLRMRHCCRRVYDCVCSAGVSLLFFILCAHRCCQQHTPSPTPPSLLRHHIFCACIPYAMRCLLRFLRRLLGPSVWLRFEATRHADPLNELPKQRCSKLAHTQYFCNHIALIS
jgi:hypothetical protein